MQKDVPDVVNQEETGSGIMPAVSLTVAFFFIIFVGAPFLGLVLFAGGSEQDSVVSLLAQNPNFGKKSSIRKIELVVREPKNAPVSKSLNGQSSQDATAFTTASTTTPTKDIQKNVRKEQSKTEYKARSSKRASKRKKRRRKMKLARGKSRRRPNSAGRARRRRKRKSSHSPTEMNFVGLREFSPQQARREAMILLRQRFKEDFLQGAYTVRWWYYGRQEGMVTLKPGGIPVMWNDDWDDVVDFFETYRGLFPDHAHIQITDHNSQSLGSYLLTDTEGIAVANIQVVKNEQNAVKSITVTLY